MVSNSLKQLGSCNITQVGVRSVFVAGKCLRRTGLHYEGNVRRTMPLCFLTLTSMVVTGQGKLYQTLKRQDFFVIMIKSFLLCHISG